MGWRWPWTAGEVETRGYTDTLVDALLRSADGVDTPKSQAHAVAVAEACALIYSRALGSAEVSGTQALSPSLLAAVGRDLIRRGESLWLIEVDGEGLQLHRAGEWDVLGGPSPSTWRYRATLDGPDRSVTRTVPEAAVVHFRWSAPAGRPWQGEGPLALAGLSAELLSSLETRIGQEAAAPVANVLPSPTDGQAATTAKLRADLKAAKGGLVLARSMMGYGDKAAAPQKDFGIARIGAMIPETSRALRTEVGRDVAAACGVPPDLLASGTDAAGQREAYRRWLWQSVVPLGRLVAEEASAKLEADVSLGFDALGAGDLQGRTRSLKQLAEAGVPLADARRIAGLE